MLNKMLIAIFTQLKYYFAIHMQHDITPKELKIAMYNFEDATRKLRIDPRITKQAKINKRSRPREFRQTKRMIP